MVLLFSIALVVYTTYVATIWFAFLHHGEKRDPRELLTLKGAALTSKLFILVRMYSLTGTEPSQFAYLALLFFLISYFLFWWTYSTNRNQPLTLAFSKNIPAHFVTAGPYNFIRHPYYTSYLLSYFAGAIATQNLIALFLAIMMLGIYSFAAKFEERKFEQSSFAGDYSKYRKRAGLFWPKIRNSSN